jgi:predicted transcriptional regulator
LTQYLDELVEKELVKEAGDGESNRVYHLTEKGRDFLREFVKMEKFSEAFGIDI